MCDTPIPSSSVSHGFYNYVNDPYVQNRFEDSKVIWGSAPVSGTVGGLEEP